MMIRIVAIVGGVDDMQRDLAGRLANYGIDAPHRISSECGIGRLHIPADTEAVLILYEHLSHSLCDKARELAKERGIPAVLISRKWAIAQPKLLQAGVLPTQPFGTQPNPQSEEVPVVTKAQAPAVHEQQPDLPQEVEDALHLLVNALKESQTLVPRISLERRADGQYALIYEAQVIRTGSKVL